LSALSIEYTLKPVPPLSSSEKKWREREVVKALYVDHSVMLVEEEREVFGDM